MMRSFLMLLMCIWVVLQGLAVSPSEAGACSCAQPPPVSEDLARKTAVFSGTVVEVVQPNNGVMRSSADQVKVLFQVEDAWKGVDATQVIVHTAVSGASCGYEGFESGKAYLVFAYGLSDKLETGICERVMPLDSADSAGVMAELGEAYKPVKQVDLTGGGIGGGFGLNFSLIIAGTAMAVLLLLVIVYFVWRSKRADR